MFALVDRRPCGWRWRGGPGAGTEERRLDLEEGWRWPRAARVERATVAREGGPTHQADRDVGARQGVLRGAWQINQGLLFFSRFRCFFGSCRTEQYSGSPLFFQL